MIVKFFKNRAFSSANSAIDYLMYEQDKDGNVITNTQGEPQTRKGARLLQGNPELVRNIANGLAFKHTYTTGALSFSETADSITDEQKWDMMSEFENTVFAGMDKQRYAITWIEHTDKGRLELNFFIAKVDLATGKSFTPYYDKADRKRMSCFRDYINTKYNLTNPLDPKHRQSTQNTNPNWRNSPTNASKKEIIASIDENLTALFRKNELNSRQDVEQTLKDNGYTITRNKSFDSVSIKHPHDPKKPNIRLKGFLYETKTYDDQSLKSQYITKTLQGADTGLLDDDKIIAPPKPQTIRYKRLQELQEHLNNFNTSKAKFINERYPVAQDESLPPLPPLDDTKNKPSEWLAIDNVLQASYDPSNNYTPLDVDWDDEPMVTDNPTPQPKPPSRSRDDDFDFGV